MLSRFLPGLLLELRYMFNASLRYDVEKIRKERDGKVIAASFEGRCKSSLERVINEINREYIRKIDLAIDKQLSVIEK